MKKLFFIASLATTLVTMVSCTNEKNKPAEAPIPATETKVEVEAEAETNTQAEIVKSTAKDNQGKTLEMSFNNSTDTVTVLFEGNTIEMKSQRPASGIWYSNEHYELRGKGDDVSLSKDGKVIFEGK